MDLTPNLAFLWTARLTAAAILLQSIEFLQIRQLLSANGVWTWDLLQKNFENSPSLIQKSLHRLLSYPGILGLVFLRTLIAAAVITTAYPLSLLALTGLSLLVALRWHGHFNGGSDAMSFVLLTALSIASLLPTSEVALKAALLYIAAHSCLSYFIAGWVKLRSPQWRSGEALVSFLKAPSYAFDPHPLLMRWLEPKHRSKGVSWAVILFECSFPVSLLHPNLALVYIALGLLFHLTNFYLFGLNRFVFAWLATYPALFFCSHMLNRW